MRRKSTFITISIAILIIVVGSGLAIKKGIINERLQAIITTTQLNKENTSKLSSTKAISETILEEWDVSANQDESIMATLYADYRLIITGTGDMHGFTYPASVYWSDYGSMINRIEIDDRITSIGNYMFYNCTSLENIVLPNSLVSIGDYAFESCESLQTVIIPGDSLETIGEYAFYSCNSELVICYSSGSNEAEEYALNNNILCAGPMGSEDISEYGDDTVISDLYRGYYQDEDGYYTDSFYIIYISGTGTMKDFDMDGSDSSKWPLWCSYLDEVKSVIIEGIQNIGEDAFYGCNNLVNLELPNTLISIENYAFYNCSSLTSVEIPHQVTSIGNYAFCNCSSLTSVKLPVRLASIGSSAFKNCSSLESITLQELVTTIDGDAFDGCDNLTIYCSSDSEAEWYAQMYEIPYIIHDDIPISGAEWDVSAAQDGSVIATLYSDYSLVITGNGAMRDFEDTADKPWIDYYKDILSVEVKEGVTYIGNYAFSTLPLVKNIELPYGLTGIGNLAFASVGGENVLESITIPSTVTSIGTNIVKGRDGITIYCTSGSTAEQYAIDNDINYILIEDTSIAQWDVSATSSDNVIATLNSDYSLVISGTGAMKDFSTDYMMEAPWAGYYNEIKDVTLEYGITRIGDYAFWNFMFMEDIILPNTLKSIGYGAFSCCELVSINIPYSVTMIDEGAFVDMWNLSEIAVDSRNEYYITEDGVLYDINKVAVICYPAGKSDISEFTIPGTVTQIANEAFNRAKALTSIELPDGLKYIGDYAFKYCTNLTSIEIPEGVISIGESIFDNCDSLEKITVSCNSYGYDYAYANEDYVGKLNVVHNYEVFEERPAQCIIPGSIEYHCKKCDKVYVNSGATPALGHAITKVEAKEATCTEEGNYEYYTCERCQEYFEDEEGTTEITDQTSVVIPATGHKISRVEEKAATCTEEGNYEYYVCEYCEKYFEDEEATTEITDQTVIIIPATEHNYTKQDTSEEYLKSTATCTTKAIYYNSCVNCGAKGETTFEDGELAAHSFTNYVSDGNATCTLDGTKTAMCDYDCGTKSEPIADEGSKLDHAYSEEWTIDKEATCTEAGSKSRHCTRENCEEKTDVTEIPMVAHSFTNYVSDGNATCTLDGTKTAACDYNCGTKSEPIADEGSKLSHSFTNYVSDGNATCTLDGTKTAMCDYNCGTKSEPIADEGSKLAHIFTIYVSDGNATCTLDGTKTATCSNCDKTDTITDEGTATGHSYGEWQVTKAATCEAKGEEKRTCTVCRNEETKEIEALGHTYSQEWTIDKAATCTEVGSKSHHCTRENCEAKTDVTEIPMLEHVFGEWTIDKEPTYEEEGHKYRVCTNCNTEKQEETIPKLTEEEITIETTYTVKNVDNVDYIQLSSRTTIDEFLKNITSNSEIIIKDKDGNELTGENNVSTGAQVITKEDAKTRYIIVLQGDINSDGEVNFRDIIMANAVRITNGENNLLKAQLFAADINNTNLIEFVDIIKMNAIRINSIG